MDFERVRLSEVCDLAKGCQVSMTTAERMLHKGPYPYYAENCAISYIDDYVYESGGVVVVAAMGQVIDGRGNLIAALEPGRCSTSEHVHTLIPHNRSDAAYIWRVLTTLPTASRNVMGTPQLRQLSSASLMAMRIPWPSASERMTFVEALNELDDEKSAIEGRVPSLYERGDVLFSSLVCASGDERTPFADVCVAKRGTDVPASERGSGKPMRVEGPLGELGRCDEALGDAPMIVVGPSARRLVAHYVDVSCHPIHETAYIDEQSSKVPLETLLFALREAGVLDRVRGLPDNKATSARLTVDDLPEMTLALGTAEAREAFQGRSLPLVQEIVQAQHELESVERRRNELIRSFYASDYAKHGQSSELIACSDLDERLDVLDLGRLARVLSVIGPLPEGIGAQDLSWELAPLVVLRACLSRDAWAALEEAAKDEGSVVSAIDAALVKLADADDLLSFLPNLSYGTSLLDPATLSRVIQGISALDPDHIDGETIRGIFALGAHDREVPSCVKAVLEGILRATCPQAQTAYLACEDDGCSADVLARLLPESTIRAQFGDFENALSTALVRAVQTRCAGACRGGFGAGVGLSIVSDEFPEWSADVSLAVVPLNQQRWTDEAPLADDPRWVLGIPPRTRANYAWIQQALSHQREGGVTILVVGNAALHSTVGSEPKLRERLIESGRLRCVVSLPARLFAGASDARSILVLGDENASDRILFVDTASMGIDMGKDEGARATRRYLSSWDVRKVVGVCTEWLASGQAPETVPGFVRTIPVEEVMRSGSLAPWEYA